MSYKHWKSVNSALALSWSEIHEAGHLLSTACLSIDQGGASVAVGKPESNITVSDGHFRQYVIDDKGNPGLSVFMW